LSGNRGGGAPRRGRRTAGSPDDGEWRKKWAVAAGVVTWLASVLATAISFDVELALSSDAGGQFKAYFLILSAVLFLLFAGLLDRLPRWSLGLLVLVSLGLFGAYTLQKDAWTCSYFPNHYEDRLTMGATLLPEARAFLEEMPPGDPGCESLMKPFGGDARKIWLWSEVRNRFLILFGLYAAAWLTLALLVLGAIRHSLSGKRSR